MNFELETAFIQCPYCWESFEILLDNSVEEAQQYTEDCYVCCRPIVIHLGLGADGQPVIEVEAELG